MKVTFLILGLLGFPSLVVLTVMCLLSTNERVTLVTGVSGLVLAGVLAAGTWLFANSDGD